MTEETKKLIDELKGLPQDELNKRLSSLLIRVTFARRRGTFDNVSFDDLLREIPQTVDAISSFADETRKTFFNIITEPELLTDESLRNEFFAYQNSLLDMNALFLVTNEQIREIRKSKYIEKILLTEKYEEFIQEAQATLDEDRDIKQYALELAYKKNPEKVKEYIRDNPDCLKLIRPSRVLELYKDTYYIAQSPEDLKHPIFAYLSLKNNFAKTIEMIRNGAEINDYFDMQLQDVFQENGYIYQPGDNLGYMLSPWKVSFENDPIATVYNSIEGYQLSSLLSIVEKDDVVKILMDNPDLKLTKELYEQLAGSDILTEELRQKFLNSDPIGTIISSGGSWGMDIDISDSKKMASFFIQNKDRLYEDRDNISMYFDFKGRNMEFIQILNRNPKIFEQLVKDDYGTALKLLSVLDVSYFGDELRDVVVKNLKEQKWVATNADNNPDVLQWLFIESMRNDPHQTLETMQKGYTIDSIREQYKANKQEIDKILVDLLLSGDTRGVGMALQFVKEDVSILISALEKDFDACSNTLVEYVDGDRNSYALPPFIKKDAKLLKKYLKKHKYIAESGNESAALIYISSMFLVESFKNDFKSTHELLNRVSRASVVEFNNEQVKEIVKLVKKNKEYMALLPDILDKCPNLFVETLKIKRNVAEECLANMNSQPLKEKYAKQIIDAIGIENIDFKKYPKYATMLGHYIFNNYKDDYAVRRTLVQNSFPFAMFDVQHIGDVEKYESNQEVLDLYSKIYFNSRSYEFNVEDEQAILKLLNSQFDCIEDELAFWNKKGLTRAEMNPTQMLALALFVKKDHYHKGLSNIAVDLFSYSDNANTLGRFMNSNKMVTLFNGRDSSILDLIETIVHEDNHAKQNEDVKNCDVHNDSLIPAYSKDEMLNIFMHVKYGISFYDDNYWSTAVEYDTESKTLIEVAEILRLDIPTNKSGKIDIKAILSNSFAKNGYNLLGERKHRENGVEECDLLGVLFDKLLPEMISSGIYSITTIKNDYPIIGYEYDLSSKPVAKISDAAILNKYLTSKGPDKEIYFTILKHRLDSTYYPKQSTEALAAMMSKYLDDNGIEDEDLKKIIDEEKVVDYLLYDQQHHFIGTMSQFNIYVNYAERVLRERADFISREEFTERMDR